MRCLSALFSFILCATTAASQAAEKDYRLLDTATFLEMETVSRPQISPDGKSVVFVRDWVEQDE